MCNTSVVFLRHSVSTAAEATQGKEQGKERSAAAVKSRG